MTDFEESIKRNMTREKYLEIRDHVYGDGNNTFNYTYGDVSSWITWNRDKNGQRTIVHDMKWGYEYDGPINDWKEEELPDFASRITTDIVFVGLNMSGDGTPPEWPLFQNARGHRKIVKTFFGTEAEGGYFTDIIKPDKRFLDKIGKPAKSDEVMEIVSAQRNVLKEHIYLFKKELDFIGAEKPLLIVFGKDAHWILKQGLDNNFLKKRFYEVVKIRHYACRGTDEEYKNNTREKLAPYIIIL